ncbi:MAG: hypothetical protein ACP5D9_01165, partial [Mariniphaga sp.]
MMIQNFKRITDSRISMLKIYLIMFLLLISVVFDIPKKLNAGINIKTLSNKPIKIFKPIDMKINSINKLKIFAFAFLLQSVAFAQTWDERPTTSYDSQYAQEFNPNTGWDRFQFYGQWNTLRPGVFNASDISSGALQFKWIEKRVICSRTKYATPYILEADLDYNGGSNRGGVVIRIQSLSESIQEPDSDPGFNREGIAFYSNN